MSTVDRQSGAGSPRRLTRRGALIWAGRGAAVLGLTALVGKLWLGGKKAPRDIEQACTDPRRVCRACPWSAKCSRPEAISHRTYGKGKS